MKAKVLQHIVTGSSPICHIPFITVSSLYVRLFYQILIQVVRHSQRPGDEQLSYTE